MLFPEKEGRHRVKKPKERFLHKYDGLKYGWFLMAKEFVIALILLLVLFNILIGVSKVTGQSMEPTLHAGDVVFFTRFNFAYERGDVVMARMPSGEFYVKRIVAVEGDTVDLRDGCLYVNGEAETADSPVGETLAEEGIVAYPYTVEAGKYFLVGDNREHSTDSRSFGALPESSIRGKLLFY